MDNPGLKCRKIGSCNSRRRHKSAIFRPRKKYVGYPQIFFNFRAKTLFLNTLQAKNRNLKKAYLKLVPARMSDDYPLHLGFVETPKKCFLNIFLNSNLRFSSGQSQGVSAWLKLICYLKQYIEYVDVQKMQTMVMEFGRTKQITQAEEKNRLIVVMLLLLVSEKSLLIRTYLGGYTTRFLDTNLSRIKISMEKLSKLHIEKLQQRVKLCQLTKDKSIEILYSKLYPNKGTYETGDYFIMEMTNPVSRNTYGSISQLGEPPKNDPYTFFNLDKKSLPPSRGIRSQNRKSSVAITPMDSVSNDETPVKIPPLDIHGMIQSIPNEPEIFSASPNSKNSLLSPALKDRFSRIVDLTRSLMPFDELVNILEDPRTNLMSIFSSRKDDRKGRLKAKFFKSKLTSGATYPKMFRLNPIILSIVFKDLSLGRAKPYVIFSISMKLPSFQMLEFSVDIANRQMTENQSAAPMTIEDFIKESQLNPEMFCEAVEVVKRGGTMKKSLRFQLIQQLKNSISSLY
jgi:hypothetical protein